MAPTSLPTLGCMIGPTSLHTLGCMMGHLTHKLMSCTMAMRCDAMRCHMPCHAIDAMRKQAEEKEAAVKVKRVGQLAAMAVRRLGRAGLTRGFNGCVDGRSSTCTCTCSIHAHVHVWSMLYTYTHPFRYLPSWSSRHDTYLLAHI